MISVMLEEEERVEVKVWRSRRRRRRGGIKGASENSCTNSYMFSISTYFPPFFQGTCPQTMVSASVVASKNNLELESHPNTLQASSPHPWQHHT